MFESGAAAGYLNPACYDVRLCRRATPKRRESSSCVTSRRRPRPDGLVELLFYRVYVLARKP